MKLKQRFKGGLIGFIGYLLSPLSWWNHAFVNVPLALAFAWPISLFWPRAFTASFIVGYWLTNVIGLALLHKGAKQTLTDQPSLYSRKALLRDLVIALFYTLLILLLIELRILKPLPEYLPKR